MPPHRHGELGEYRATFGPRNDAVGAEQGGQQGWAPRHGSVTLLDHPELVASEHGQIAVLLVALALILEDQQSGLHHLDHEAEVREVAGGPPDADPSILRGPAAQVNTGPLDSGAEPHEHV